MIAVLSVLMWIAAIVVGLIVLYLVVMFVVTMVTLAMGNAPPGIEVLVTSASSCRLDEEFEVTAVVRNTLERARRITSVDIGASYLDGFVVCAIAPEPTTRSDGPVLGQQIQTMDVPLAAGASQNVTFTLRAAKQGEFQGDLTVYVDGGHFRYIATPLRTRVDDASPAEARSQDAANIERATPEEV